MCSRLICPSDWVVQILFRGGRGDGGLACGSCFGERGGGILSIIDTLGSRVEPHKFERLRGGGESSFSMMGESNFKMSGDHARCAQNHKILTHTNSKKEKRGYETETREGGDKKIIFYCVFLYYFFVKKVQIKKDQKSFFLFFFGFGFFFFEFFFFFFFFFLFFFFFFFQSL